MSLSLSLAFCLTKYDGPCDRILCTTEEGKGQRLGRHEVSEVVRILLLSSCETSVSLSGQCGDLVS